eukprot:gene42724-53001_t
MDSGDFLWVMIYGHANVLESSPDGQTTTALAFSGDNTPDGDGGPPLDAAIRAVDLTNNVILTAVGTLAVSGESGLGGLAASALIASPHNCAVDTSGNLYFSQPTFNVVRVVDFPTKTLSPFIGTYNTAGYAGDGGYATSSLITAPKSIWVDTTHFVFISDQVSTRNNIRRIDLTTGLLITIVGRSVGSHDDGSGFVAGSATSASIGSFVNGGNSFLDDDVYYMDSGHTGPALAATFGIITTLVSDG